MKKFINEFKEFIDRGDVMSMAVGIIIGAAFTSIVNAIVEQLISPLIGIVCGGIDFNSLAIRVGDASFGVGIIINAIITFFATALVLFLILKGYNGMKDKMASLGKKDEPEVEEEPEVSPEIQLLTEIRDLLKNNNK